MDRLAVEIALHGTDETARRALAEFGLRSPQAPADARRALMGYALMIGETAEFDFALSAAEPKPTPADSRPDDADANGVRDEPLPGGFTVARVDHGSPVVITVRPIGGANARDRRIPVDAQALNDFESLRSACAAATRGEVGIVQPDEDAAREIPGWPDRLTAKAPTSTGNGRVTNKPGGAAVGMSGGISEAELADFLRRAEHATHLDLLSRTSLGRTVLPAVAASRESARAAVDEAHRLEIWQRSPAAYYDHLMAVVARQRRDRQMAASALGRSVLAQEQADDAARR
jgi:hypothetical protein